MLFRVTVWVTSGGSQVQGKRPLSFPEPDVRWFLAIKPDLVLPTC